MTHEQMGKSIWNRNIGEGLETRNSFCGVREKQTSGMIK